MNCTVYCIDIQNINLHNIFFNQAHYISSFIPVDPKSMPNEKNLRHPTYGVFIPGFRSRLY